MTESSEKNIAQLQMYEQQLQNFGMQRQQFQLQMVEIENALQELEKTKEKPFKIVGSLMIQTEKSTLQQELQSRKEVLALRVKNLEKQETQLKEKAEKLQQEVFHQLQQKEGKK